MDTLLLYLKPFHEIGTKLIVLFFAMKLLVQWWNESGKLYFEAERNASFVNENLLKKDILTAQETLTHNTLASQEKLEQLLAIQKNIELWQEKNFKNHQTLAVNNSEKNSTFTLLQQKKAVIIAQNKQTLADTLHTLDLVAKTVQTNYQPPALSSTQLSNIIQKITQEPVA